MPEDLLKTLPQLLKALVKKFIDYR